ncbi:adenosylmethionine decarboxylase [Paenibacillus hamazuiensis]|uniref:adenosylmethionine decarboxylase n=1 Tax=Paenibacillus hamazuiensis TaxID=2936508 RepID=UPI0020103BCD|nr:adenosylmethionine decarboxylase [Paenibacillus hamazuiensis]
MEYSTYGRHIAVDVWGVDFDILNDAESLRHMMTEAADKCMAKVLSVRSESFDPNGCTIVLLLSESHLSIHTYPEKRFAAIDCYTCGQKADPQAAIDFLVEQLMPEKTYAKKLIRGIGEIEVVE